MVSRNVLCIGVFDGLHLGHQALINAAAEHARKLDAPLVVVTFDEDPDEYFSRISSRKSGTAFTKKLMSNKDRLQALSEFDGVSNVFKLETSSDFFKMSPSDFLTMLEWDLEPCAIFVGDGFRFGAGNSGNTETLYDWAASHDCICKVVPLCECGGVTISSTRIRELLQDGCVMQASKLLGGRYHSIYGEVVRGRGQGSGFGFATANLDLAKNGGILLPKEGVYGGYAMAIDENDKPLWEKSHACAINVGKAKSFRNAKAEVEVHILGISEELYGKTLRVDFVEWLRDQRKFKSKDELIATVMDNINWVKNNLEGGAHGAN
jgi:riboflavin kinase / FMN adenylyltransferase